MKDNSSTSADMITESNLNGMFQKYEHGILIMITMISLLTRAYFLRFYDVISSDGTTYALVAKALKSGNLEGLSTSGFYPVLIWLVSQTGADMETSGRLVSVILGGLLVIPLYFLGRDMFSRQTAFAAITLTIAWPPLLSYSCEVMTQATYVFLIITGILFFWRTYKSPTLMNGTTAGLCFGLAYLTRAEGLLLFLLIPLPVLFYQRSDLKKLSYPLAAYCIIFLSLIFANMLLVHHVTGSWQLATKTSAALNDGLSYYLKIPDLNYITDYKPKSYLDIFRDHPEYIWHNTFKNFKNILNSLIPVPLWILAVIGFTTGGFLGEFNLKRLFLLLTFVPLGVLMVFYYTGPEYTQPYLPILFLWVAEGMNQSEMFVRQHVQTKYRMTFPYWAKTPLTVTVSVIFALSLLIRMIPDTDPSAPYDRFSDGGRRDCKNIGQLLKKHLPQGKIMTRWSRIAFYSERDWVSIPNSSENEILKFAKDNGVRFLIVDGSLIHTRPQLGDLHDPVGEAGPDSYFELSLDNGHRARPGLRPFLLYRNPSSMGVAVYEFVM
jgi:4-amino-4-deoxy-L-arabinose transferase-like glycosyltransferase